MFKDAWAWVKGVFEGIQLAFSLPVVQAKAEQEEEILPPEGQVWKNYVLVGGQRVAVREYTVTTSEVYFLLGDHLGSTSVTTDESGVLVSEIRYSAYGETRYSDGDTPTDYQYTGQLSKESTIGLYYYNARWYDPYINHFVQADTIVPLTGNINKSTQKEMIEASIVSPFVVNIIDQQSKTLYKSGDGSINDLDRYNNESTPTVPHALDRYAYSFYNPIRYIDPTGHEPTPPATDWLQWLSENIQIIWRSAPSFAKELLFTQGPSGGYGTRIITVDHPHSRVNYWHVNSDLKILRSINHKNIEPLVERAVLIAFSAKYYALTAVNSLMPIVSGEVFVPFIIITPGMLKPLYNQQETWNKPSAIPV